MSDQTFLPSVSTLLSKDSVPVAVVTSVLDLEQLLDNLFYKYFDVNVIGEGEGKSYRITMVSFGTAQCTIPSTEITLSLNKGDLGTEFDMYLSYQWGILQYLPKFKMNQFANTNESFLDLLCRIAKIDSQSLLQQAIIVFEEGESEQEKIQGFIQKYNNIHPSTPITVESSSDIEEYMECIAEAICSSGENLYNVVLGIYLAEDLETFFEKAQDLFSELIGIFSKQSLKKLLIPHITAGLNDLTLALEFPQKWLKPIDAKGNVIEGETSMLKFTAGSVNFDSETGLNFAQQSNLSFTKSQIGNTGFTLSFDNAKIDFSRSENISEATAAGYPSDFVGVYVEEAEIGLPDGWAIGDNSTAKIVGRDMLIGTGGFSGTIGLEAKEGELRA